MVFGSGSSVKRKASIYSYGNYNVFDSSMNMDVRQHYLTKDKEAQVVLDTQFIWAAQAQYTLPSTSITCEKTQLSGECVRAWQTTASWRAMQISTNGRNRAPSLTPEPIELETRTETTHAGRPTATCTSCTVGDRACQFDIHCRLHWQQRQQTNARTDTDRPHERTRSRRRRSIAVTRSVTK